MNNSSIGTAGEHLVMADLVLKDFEVYKAQEGLPHDLLIDTGSKYLKVQVKAVSKPNQAEGKTPSYTFRLTCGRNNIHKKYSTKDVDLFAIVALDILKVGYTQNNGTITNVAVREDSNKFNYDVFKDYALVNNLFKSGKNQKEISQITDISIDRIYKYLRDDYQPTKQRGYYFSELVRNRDWFLDFK